MVGGISLFLCFVLVQLPNKVNHKEKNIDTLNQYFT